MTQTFVAEQETDRFAGGGTDVDVERLPEAEKALLHSFEGGTATTGVLVWSDSLSRLWDLSEPETALTARFFRRQLSRHWHSRLLDEAILLHLSSIGRRHVVVDAPAGAGKAVIAVRALAEWSSLAQPAADESEMGTQARESEAYSMLSDVASWLKITKEDAAKVVGVRRTTPYAWKEGRVPRPATARRLYYIHNLLSAVVGALGERGAISWLESGERPPRTLLLDGKIQETIDAARPIIFPDPGRPAPEIAAWYPDQDAPAVDQPTTPPSFSQIRMESD